MRYRYGLALLFILTGSAQSEETIFNLEDFAWGMKLNTTGNSAFYHLSVPAEVYQGVTRPDLGDLRIFNGQGQVVPYELKLPPLRELKESSRQAVKLFPLYGNQTTSMHAISINLSRRMGEGYMGITAHEQIPKQDEVLRGYLIQLWDSAKHPRADRLHLTWQESRQGRVHRLKVELSNDMENWTVHNPAAVVTDLRFNGDRLQQNDISLGKTSARYLRLSPATANEIMQLTSARMTPIDQNEEGIRRQLPIKEVSQGGVVKDKGVEKNTVKAKTVDELLFELSGPFSRCRIRDITQRTKYLC